MRCLLLMLAALAGLCQAADIIDPATCTSYPCLIFNDDFDYFDFNAWEHEMTLAGGGNWEFQAYVNNRSITYTHDGKLFIRPQLTADMYGEEFLTSGDWNLWALGGRNDQCTGNAWYGCERVGNAQNLLNPVMSGKLRTMPFFSLQFGRVEVVAKMPVGAWLWPAVWMMPKNSEYGTWPASGEIDIIESRGNEDYGTLGVDHAASTLHWGPIWYQNRYDLTTQDYTPSDGSTYGNAFHTWVLDWTPDSLIVSVDGVQQLVVDPGTNFWDFGGFASTGMENPWRYGTKMSPFDKEFYLMLNLAVGGTNGYFPDEVPSNPPKPWANTDQTGPLNFWNGRDTWLPTWQHGEGKISENAALQVESVKIYKLSA